MLVEVCVDHANMAIQAAQLGARRVELCAHLDAGGTTPSAGMIHETTQACANQGCTVHVMIRPRPGDFVYDLAELRMMRHDIDTAARCGAAGVVFGVLTRSGAIDASCVSDLVSHAHAHKLHVTFHRAFDLCTDPLTAVDTLVTCGVDHLLTSGQATSALAGLETLRQLVHAVDHRVQVIAAAGIDHRNVHTIMSAGVDAVHLSARQMRSTTADPLGFGVSWDFNAEKLRQVMQQVMIHQQH